LHKTAKPHRKESGRFPQVWGRFDGRGLNGIRRVSGGDARKKNVMILFAVRNKNAEGAHNSLKLCAMV